MAATASRFVPSLFIPSIIFRASDPMTTHSEEQRTALRARVIAQRKALTDEQLQRAAHALSHLFESTPEYQQATAIAAYWPVRGEADARPLLERALIAGKRVYLPIVRADSTLLFAPYDADTPMENNRLGIPEPQVAAERLAAPRDLDLVILPLTAFDDAGNRLGMGGGFYDRSFAFLRDEVRPHPVLAGAAHEFQHSERLPVCDWDVPAQLVVTDERVHRPQADLDEAAAH